MKLSILIPARNEPLLRKTVEDIFEHATGDIEVLVGLDEVPKDWTTIIRKGYRELTVLKKGGMGQRALTNHLASIATGDYVMKTDAHCSFGPGFDKILLSEIDDNTILAPQMGVLDPISWAINGKKMTSRYCFDRNFVMQYDNENDNTETMCLQGSCWVISKEAYFKWSVCDETLGSWGGQAAELGISAWLHGGRCKSTKSTYYGHVFRHSDSEFPYERGISPGKFATDELKRRYGNDKRIANLVEYFNFPADWKA